jgi:hypothetical protein
MARLATIASRPWMAVTLLLLLGSTVQWVIIARTTLPALDSVRLVSLARQFEAAPLSAPRSAEEQPLYPACVAIVHSGLDASLGSRPGDWILASQLTAGFFAAVAVVPVYWIVLLLAGRVPAIIAGLLWIFLPEAAWLGGHALADSVHLALLATAMAASLSYLRPTDASRRRSHWLLLSGFSAGLAATARAEVLVLLPAIALVLLASAAGNRGPVRARALRGALGLVALSAGFTLPVGTYMLLAGADNVPSVAARLLGRPDPTQSPATQPDGTLAGAASPSLPPLPDGSPLTLSAKDDTQSIRAGSTTESLQLAAKCLARAYGYWLIPLAIWGAWCWPSRKARRSAAAERLPQVFFVMYLAAILAFVLREGYLEPRHFLPLVVASMACVAVGVLQCARTAASWAARERDVRVHSSPLVATAVVVAILVLAMVPRTFRSLHASRLPHRLAGEWLLTNAPREANVVDTRGWTGLKTDLPTFPLDRAQTVLGRGDEPLFLVVERDEVQRDSPRGGSLRHLLQPLGEPVATFPRPGASPGKHRGAVVEVYRWKNRGSARMAAAGGPEGG